MESVRTIYRLGLEFEISHQSHHPPHPAAGCTQFSLSIRRAWVDTLVLWLIGLRCVTLSLRHPYYEKVADEIVCHSYPTVVAWIWMTFCSSRSQPVGLAILSLQVVCDLTITASMVYYLYIRRSEVKRCVNLLPECSIRSG